MNGDEIRDKVLGGAVLLTLVLVVLRMTHVIGLDWVWVLAPVWGLVVFAFVGSGLALVWVLLSSILKPKRQ